MFLSRREGLRGPVRILCAHLFQKRSVDIGRFVFQARVHAASGALECGPCEGGEIGRRNRFRFCRRKVWGFESPLSHHPWMENTGHVWRRIAYECWPAQALQCNHSFWRGLFCRMRPNPNPCSICAFRRQLAAFIPRVTVVTRGTCWEKTGGEQRNRPNYRVLLGRAAPWRPRWISHRPVHHRINHHHGPRV